MRRALIRSALALAALLLLVLGAAWIWRIPLLTLAALRLINSTGMGPATLVITAATLESARIENVRLHAGAIRVREVILSYNPLELAQKHVRKAAIVGLEVASAREAEGPGITSSPFAAGVGDLVFPVAIDAVEVADARIAAGTVEATLNARFALAKDGIHAGAGAADIAALFAGIRRSAHLDVPELALVRDETGMRLRVSQARMVPRELPWTAEAIAGEADWQGMHIKVQLTEARLVDHQEPPLVAPLRISAMAELEGPRIDATVAGHVGAGEVVRLEGKSHHDQSSGSGSAHFTLGPVTFRPGALQPGEIVPLISGVAQDVAGSVAVAGELHWTGGALTTDVEVGLKHLAFATQTARLSEVEGAIRLNRLYPPATPPDQMLSATIDAAGLPTAKLRLVYQLIAKPALRIDHAVLGVMGGEIAAARFTIDPAAPRVSTAAEIMHVDLARSRRSSPSRG
jgi:hypothetical protein